MSFKELSVWVETITTSLVWSVLHSNEKAWLSAKQHNHTMYIQIKGETIYILVVYVDDIVLTGNDFVELKRLKASLAKKFEMKDWGELRYFLGIEVAQSKKRNSYVTIKLCYRYTKWYGDAGCINLSTLSWISITSWVEDLVIKWKDVNNNA
jgi:Reverse transcriptase (RNA-dependent DNA polymerase)